MLGDVGVGTAVGGGRGARRGDGAGDAALDAALAVFPNLKYAKTHNPTQRMAPIGPA